MSSDDIPYEAWLTALLSLDGMGPARLAALLESHDAVECWERLCDGREVVIDSVSADMMQQWRSAARRFDVADRWRAARSLGIEVSELGSAEYPARLVDDPEPPMLMFRRGLPVPDAFAVGLVGTRRCTSYGRRVAFDLGAQLAAAGVTVVSGLALGIDAAAHEGALSSVGTTPVAVVGSGLDVVYPRQNRRLWDRVAKSGTLLSEAPPGAPPERWRFPARNRIIAGLSDAVIVVESGSTGGSLLTVDEAQFRDVPVGAVPGPVTSRSSQGTNNLIAEGAVPVLGADDIFAMIGYTKPRESPKVALPGDATFGATGTSDGSVGSVDDECDDLLDALGWTPLSFDQVCAVVNRPPIEIAAQLEALVAAGTCIRTGPFIERVRP